MHDSLLEWGQWLRASGASEATVTTRLNGVRTLQHHAGLSDPREVSTGDVVGWLAGQRSAWTRATYHASAQAWGQWLVAMGYASVNPAGRVPRPRRPRGVPHPVAERTVRMLLADPPGVRAYAYVVLASFAGLRCVEIARVRGEDVNPDTRWLFVDGKGGQQAWVPMHPVVQRLASGMPPVGPWFPGRKGGHVAPDTVSRVVRNAFRSVGSSASAHDCRHLFGSAVLAASGNTRVAQRLLRHESLSSTQIYTAVGDTELVAAVNSLAWVA